jgi:hypothetical protein
MAIFNIYLDVDNEYLQLIKDIYKTLVILIIFQFLVVLSNGSSGNLIDNSLKGSFLNDNFMTLLINILIGFFGYYLVFNKILEFY